nr:Nbr1 [Thermochaetoides thermophila]
MATPAVQVTPDTLITFKVSLDGSPRRFKLPLRDVGINVLEGKLRAALNIPPEVDAVFERFSDSAAAFVVLDQNKPAVYKQLYRAAKAKQKLKLRVTTKKPEEANNKPQPAAVEDAPEQEAQQPVESVPAPEREADSATAENIASAPERPASPMPEEKQVEITQAAAEQSTTETNSAIESFGEKLKTSTEYLREVLNEASTAPAAAPEQLPPVPAPAPAAVPLPCRVDCPPLRSHYAVCCNNCDRTIPDAHYHCSTCDDGDFDLCQECVDRGVTCKGADHWMIKRFVRDGVIINSTTERLPPKTKPAPTETPKPATTSASPPRTFPTGPAAPVTSVTPPIAPPVPTMTSERIIPVFNDFLYSSMRTCNCCVRDFPEVAFVHCTTCEDYDLCRSCFAKNRHGHHPGHAFVPAVEGTRLEPEVARLLAPGRGVIHNALCDGCDNTIRGVRHKCLNCPDWDYCSQCILNAPVIHPGHRFVPIYEPLEQADSNANFRFQSRPVHFGICCDGPLCNNGPNSNRYIVGDRYKCAVCHDTDFCEACEASPANTHNKTHPLIKFKTPVRHVSVTTTGENEHGRQMPPMGDRRVPRPRAPESAPHQCPAPSNVGNVQTVVDVKPIEPEVPVKEEKVEEKVEKKPEPVVEKEPSAEELEATFVRDTVQDGTVLAPNHLFEQTWVLRNTGKVAWPAGCSVKFVGGDYMGRVDSAHPAASKEVEESCESTVCDRAVQPGEEAPFTVLLRTPYRACRVISHWRLTTPKGTKFGHRLWCDVVVEKPKSRSPSPAPAFVEEKAKEVSPEPEPATSQMIFPKLDRESPVMSVHEEEARSEGVPTSVAVPSIQDEFEDCEDVDWPENGSEDGFLTDEEYDVLDASDEEFSMGLHPSTSKQK